MASHAVRSLDGARILGLETLEAVVDFYSEGLQNSPNIDPLMKGPHFIEIQ